MAKGGRRAHSGRRPTPVEKHIIQGTFRTTRHSEQATASAAWPDPPAHLNARERELWDGLKAHCAAWTAPSDWLAINGVVSIMDKVLRIQAAQRATEEAANPIAFKFTPSADGEANMEPKENPLFGMELKAWDKLRAFIGLVGLSPADRARMHKGAEGDAPANPLDRFLKKTGTK